MRRAIRLDRSADRIWPRAVAGRASPYLCSSCTSQSSSFSTSSPRPADAKLPVTERLRRRIWGTDQPPGQKDPYTRMPAADRTQSRVQDAEAGEREGPKPTRVAMTETDPSYVPATTWEGLETVGGFGHWWKENWDPEHQFEGFLPSEMAKDKETVTAALRRAMVEVFALREAGIPLSEISKAVSEWDPTSSVQIRPTATGATLQFSPAASLDDIIQSLTPAATETDETAVKENPSESEEDVAADRSTVDPLHPEPAAEVDETAVKKNPSESEEDVAADRSTVDPLHPEFVGVDETMQKGNPSESEEDVAADRSTVDPLHDQGVRASSTASSDLAWLEISLDDPEIKFAVLKRTMQLTGIRIPDPLIRLSNNPQSLLKFLITPPKPRKIFEAIQQQAELTQLPNVVIHDRRQTPVDRERSVGRWKLIEKELEERGLPIFGKTEIKDRRRRRYP